MYLLAFKCPHTKRVWYYGASHRPVETKAHAARFTLAGASLRVSTLCTLAYGPAPRNAPNRTSPAWNCPRWGELLAECLPFPVKAS